MVHGHDVIPIYESYRYYDDVELGVVVVVDMAVRVEVGLVTVVFIVVLVVVKIGGLVERVENSPLMETVNDGIVC